jgi:hypothetical protein
MKKYVFILLVLWVFQACKKEECPKPPCADADIKKGLIAFYPFNGTANDASGNGNHGVAKNGASFGSDFLGRPNKAAQFDGIDDYIIVNDNGKLNSKAITFSAFVLVNNVNRRHTVLNRVNFEDASAVSWGAGQSLDITNKWEMAVDKPTNQCSQRYVFDPSNNISAPETMLAGRWYHVLATFGEGKQNLYIDGKLRASKTRDFMSLKECVSAQLVIGGWWKNDIISIDGKIDEVRIYNRVISECEINELARMFKDGEDQ